MDPNTAPRIAPARVSPMAGAPLDIIAYVDPAQCPDGMDIVLCKPGELQPLGSGRVGRGCMVVIFPPEVAAQVLDAMRKAMAAQGQPGGGLIRPPGA